MGLLLEELLEPVAQGIAAATEALNQETGA
jgi:hypothetical protein